MLQLGGFGLPNTILQRHKIHHRRNDCLGATKLLQNGDEFRFLFGRHVAHEVNGVLLHEFGLRYAFIRDGR